MTTATTRTYFVSGMTCHHCTLSVQEEVCEVAGVASAVAEAGYAVIA